MPWCYDADVPAAAVPLARQIADRATRDPAFARVLDAILDAPTAPPGRLELVATGELNEQRRSAVVRSFVEGALSTPKVQAILLLRSPQAVHRLRSRGKLIGAAVGNQTWFPAWQFDVDRVRPDLPQILELLATFTTDSLAGDRVMRLTHDELGGLSIAEALRRPKWAETAWRILAAVGA